MIDLYYVLFWVCSFQTEGQDVSNVVFSLYFYDVYYMVMKDSKLLSVCN